jgi:hypothetical protein
LDKKQNINSKYFIKGDILNVLDAWEKIIKQMEVGEKMSPTIMIHDAFVTYSQSELDAFPDWKSDYIIKNRPIIDKYRTIFSTWYETHKELLKKREIYGKLEWQTGPIQKNDSIFNRNR